MSIIKSKHASNFTVIPNEVFKQGLSIEAVGLLTYLLSLPHDWVIYKTHLHKTLSCGRDKTDRIFKELQDAGYILSVEHRNELGKIHYEHVVYDMPYNGEPVTGNPLTDKPYTGNPSTVNPQLLNTNTTKDVLQNKKEDILSDFDIFWNAYSKKVGAAKCKSKWLKLTDDQRRKCLNVVGAYVRSTPDPQFRKNPITWLNGEHWEDDIQKPKSNKSDFASPLI